MQEQINAAETYNKLAKSYSEKIDYKPHNAFYDRPNTLSLLPDLKGKHVLDAGCGPGKYAEIMIKRGAKVIGVDISRVMISEAKKRNPNQGEFFQYDITKSLPFDKSSFDIVICPLVLEYIYNWTPVFREFNRVLKKGGVFVYSVTHPSFDYSYYKSKEYFNVEKVDCTWKGFGEPVKVASFRRSFMETINPLMKTGFQLSEVLEPQPVTEFKEHDPKHYKELMAFPAFLCIKAQKQL